MSIQHFRQGGVAARPIQDDFEFLLSMVTQEKTASEPKACVVCGGASARGIHFGVIACAACVAFFRRTIAEKRTYSCRTARENCQIVHGFTQRKNCRLCRYKKCLAMGMLPQKVQKSRRPTGHSFEQLPQIVKTIEINCSVNELAYKYSILNEQRMKHYDFDPNEAATFEKYVKTTQAEPEFLSNYLNSSGALNAFADEDKFLLLKNYILVARLVEQARLTMQHGGIRQQRFYMLDGRYLGATEIELTKFYSCSRSQTESPMLTDPNFMARMVLPLVQNQLKEIVPAMERSDFIDEEITGLLNLVLYDSAIPELTLHGLETVRKKQQQVIRDLCEYYKSTGMDIQIRLANLILLLSPIQACPLICFSEFMVLFQKDVNACKELITMTELMLAKKSSNQVPAQLCLYEQRFTCDYDEVCMKNTKM